MEIWFMFSLFWTIALMDTLAMFYFIREKGFCWFTVVSTVVIGNLALICWVAPFVIM